MKVVLYPDPVLLRPAARVEAVTDDIRERAGRMRRLMGLEDGIGLAAPQVGWGVRLLLASPGGDEADVRALVNPRIARKSGGQEWGEEGCLSFPGIFGEVLRARKVRVEATDLEGRPVVEEAEGLYARVLQHEIDHLEGVLFVTKMRPADKAAAKAQLEQLVRRYEARKETVPGSS